MSKYIFYSMNLEKSFFAYIQNRRKYMLQQKLGLLISLSPKIFILITSCATTVVSGSLITFLSPNFHFFSREKENGSCDFFTYGSVWNCCSSSDCNIDHWRLIFECIIYVGDLKGNVNEGQLLICGITYQKLSLIHIPFQITHIYDAFANEHSVVNVTVTTATTVSYWGIGEKITAAIMFFSEKEWKFGLRKVMREEERTVAAQLVMRIKFLGDNEINNPSFCRCYFFFLHFFIAFWLLRKRLNT
jgi:hypothetical protein